jgi:adenine-specific DNA-methyltransferase
MGTKRRLAPRVAAIIREMRPGPALDLFAGMCSVGREVAPSRNVWTNDAQHFASEFGAAFFTSPPPRTLPEAIRAPNANLDTIVPDETARLLVDERATLDCEDLSKLQRFHHRLDHIRTLDGSPGNEYFASTYAGTFLGLRQCVELDQLRSAIEAIPGGSEKRWALIALCAAVFRASTSTGHFAQYLKPKASTLRFFLRKRRLSLYAVWRNLLGVCKPLRNDSWRRGNVAFMGDAVDVLRSVQTRPTRPAIVYADPPYTRDHYSRFYHFYETIWKNDRPAVVGQGLCRSDVQPSQFSTKSLVDAAMTTLFNETSAMGADLVLSYPTNGLLDDARSRLRHLIRERYATLKIITIQGVHSTLGASKGFERQPVTELLFRATGAR